MIEPPARQVAHRVAAEREAGNQDDVDHQHEASQAHAELMTIVRQQVAAAIRRPPEGDDRVPAEEDDE